MTQEDKELLFIDLCARIPYGVKVCAVEDLAMTLKQIDYKGFCESWENEYFKYYSRWTLPYLRPISSMTEEEKESFKELCTMYNGSIDTDYESFGMRILETHPRYGDSFCQDFTPFDWLNTHHFDYRGLIEKGLALEALEGMYNIK